MIFIRMHVRYIMHIDYGWKGPEDFRKWGPYLSYGTHASSEVRISWQSKFYALNRWIDYGLNPDCGHKIEQKIGDQIEPMALHTIRLTNLSPNTTYYYKISRIEDLKEDPQPIYTFKTGPPEGENVKFDFCIMGDIHAQDGNARTALNAMMVNVPETKFLLSCGDAVTHGGDEVKWNDFFYQISPFNSKFPIMHTTGNHDTDHPETYAHFIQTFHHPYHDLHNGAYYYFIYGNCVFIMLDSTNAGQSSATQGVISDEQMDWLEGLLEELALKNYWIFVFMHHQVYSTGDSGMMEIYNLAYRDLFDEYHVDGVFYGHDHHFEVFWTGRDKDWGGTHYCLIGNGGGGLGTFNMDPKRKPTLPNYLWTRRSYIFERDGILGGNIEGGIRDDEKVRKSYVYGIMEHGFTHMQIDGDQCEFKMWGLQNRIYYKDTIKRTGQGKKYHTPEFMQE
jgi:predicted phosphodiesterase